MRVLLIEDDPETASYVVTGLEGEGHTVDHLCDGHDGVVQAVGEAYDIVILDRMLPGLDGLSLVKALRAAVGQKVPVIFLTSLGGVDDRVDGLNVGGDDYLVKPFAFSELMARVNALARRPHLKDAETKLPSATSRWISSRARSRAAAMPSTCSRASSACSRS